MSEEEIKQKKNIEFWESEVQKHLDNNDIKSIVTKECFQSVSYEV